MLSKLTNRVCLLALRNQLKAVRVAAAPQIADKFDHVHTASNQNFARTIFLSSILHDSKNYTVPTNLRKASVKPTKVYSVEDDKIIKEHVKKFGKETETWKKLAKILGKKYFTHIKNYFEFYLENTTPLVTGRFSEKEDEMILNHIERNGKDLDSLANLTKLLGRGSPQTIRNRVEYLVSGNVRKLKTWKLVEDEEMMQAIFKIERVNPRDITSLESVVFRDFKIVSQKLERSMGSCERHWLNILLPILKTHINGLPLDNEWKKDLIKYIIKQNISHYKELDLALVMEQVCPGQTISSVLHYLSNCQNHKKTQKPSKYDDLPLYRMVEIRLNDAGPNCSFHSGKVAEKSLQHKSDIVKLYESMI